MEEYTDLILGTKEDLEKKKQKSKHKHKEFGELVWGKDDKK